VNDKGNVLNEQIFPGNVTCFERLKTSVGDGSTIAFTGAGTSTPLYPTWISLLQELIDQAENEGLVTKNDLQELRGLVDADPLELASHLEDTFTRQRFRDRLATIFEPKGKSTQCHDLLVRLSLKAIVTLNYDDGLEAAFSAVNSAPPQPIRAQDRAEIVRWQQGRLFGPDKLPILHWHGTPSDPKEMVFTGDDYNCFYNNRENVDFVEQLWRDNQLLVVGFGFSDPFLVRVAESVLRALPSDNRHFALIGVRSGKQITTLFRRQFTKKYRLTPIFYEIRADGVREDHSDLTKLLSMLVEGDLSVIKVDTKSRPPATPEQQFTPQSHAGHREFEKELLVSPGGRTLYVEPRLQRPVQLSGTAEAITYEPVGVDQLVTSSSSFVITTRPEYGSTTLCRRIVADTLQLGITAVYRDANLLPNYKNKLRHEFGLPTTNPNPTPTQVLLLDAFNADRHERLLKEIIGLQHFARIILVLRSSGPTPSTILADGVLGINFEPLVLSHLDRSDIRSLATDLFDSSDTDMISAVVEKVYGDLLALCIPLTPTNIIMYLTILYKEGDFSPLNRVQIVDRYIQELLRRPGDAYQESFSAKNKIYIISSFIYLLYNSGHTTFSETEWLSFCRQHMLDTLLSFNERFLLNELLLCRIFTNEALSLCVRGHKM
jgi:SIR2-like domain